MSDIENWIALSDQLQFQFKKGISAFFESETAKKLITEGDFINDQNLQKGLDLLNNPLMKSLLEKIFLGCAIGEYRNYEFYIYRSAQGHSSNRTSYDVNISLFFKKSFDLGLRIYQENIWGKIGKFFGAQDIQLGNKALDANIMIKGKNEMQVQLLLAKEVIQQKLLSLFSYSSKFQVQDFGIKYKQPGKIIEFGKLHPIMDLMVDAAVQFDQ